MTIRIRAFEQNPQIKKFTEPKELKKLHVVVQNSKRACYEITGLEPMLIMYLWNNMTTAQFALVFDDETKRLLGYVSKDGYGIPRRYKEPEEDIFFDDMYQRI